MPIKGFWNIIRRRVKDGSSFNPATAELIVSIPNIKMAKPTIIMPISLFLSFLENIMTATPITASTGVKLDGFKNRMAIAGMDISMEDAPVRVFTVHTDEEIVVARKAAALLQKQA